ncbi:MAG: hypothetical protein KF905_12325 [Flavobacteriales bacterium]|nr:hypothetical protein [Flavobacteriales bacterium]
MQAFIRVDLRHPRFLVFCTEWRCCDIGQVGDLLPIAYYFHALPTIVHYDPDPPHGGSQEKRR